LVPIQIGDLVEFEGVRWLVSHQHRGVRTVILRQLDGASQEIANDHAACKVIAHLPTKWPFLTLPEKTSPITEITIARESKTLALKPMHAWVPAEPLHNGGVIYFHPKLDLRTGEVLAAKHANGTLTRVNITKSFGTLRRKLAIEEAKKPVIPQTRYDHLLMADDSND
jgi:hypothetical protein